MQVRCAADQLEFQGLAKCRVVGVFCGGTFTSDGGALLLREIDARCRIIGSFTECFVDHRDRWYSEHLVQQIVIDVDAADDPLHGNQEK